MSAKRTTHDLHNVFGIYALPVLIVVFLTGAAFTYYDPVEKAVNRLAGLPAEPETPQIVAAPDSSSLDTLMQVDTGRVPEGKVTYIVLPGGSTEPMTLYLEMPDGSQIGHRVEVALDPHTGAVLRLEDSHRTWVKGAFQTLMSWYFGTWGGLFSHTLYALCSLSLLGLAATGWLKYLHKRRGYAANRAKRQAERAVGTPWSKEEDLTKS